MVTSRRSSSYPTRHVHALLPFPDRQHALNSPEHFGSDGGGTALVEAPLSVPPLTSTEECGSQKQSQGVPDRLTLANDVSEGASIRIARFENARRDVKNDLRHSNVRRCGGASERENSGVWFGEPFSKRTCDDFGIEDAFATGIGFCLCKCFRRGCRESLGSTP